MYLDFRLYRKIFQKTLDCKPSLYLMVCLFKGENPKGGTQNGEKDDD